MWLQPLFRLIRNSISVPFILDSIAQLFLLTPSLLRCLSFRESDCFPGELDESCLIFAVLGTEWHEFQNLVYKVFEMLALLWEHHLQKGGGCNCLHKQYILNDNSRIVTLWSLIWSREIINSLNKKWFTKLLISIPTKTQTICPCNCRDVYNLYLYT